MTNRQAKQFIESVLDYFSKMERAAELRNKRVIVRHFQECWLVVCEAYYGARANPAQEILHTATAGTVASGTARPRWFQEKYSRPLRLVVARTARRFVDQGHGAACEVRYDVLSCGHQIEDHSAELGQPPARHRRCKECVQVNGSAAPASAAQVLLGSEACQTEGWKLRAGMLSATRARGA